MRKDGCVLGHIELLEAAAPMSMTIDRLVLGNICAAQPDS